MDHQFKKRCLPSSKGEEGLPPPSPSRTIYTSRFTPVPGSDKCMFSPSRSGSLGLSKVPSTDPIANKTGDSLYAQILGAEILGSPTRNKSLFVDYRSPGQLLPSPSPQKHYQQPRINFLQDSTLSASKKRLFTTILESPRAKKYQSLPLSQVSQELLTGPRFEPRSIAKTPYKVLDAPDLQDDFYLNLVDWSASNVLGVGLGSCVYLWSACTSKVTKLCDLGTGDSVTSLSWCPKGTLVSVGTNKGHVQLWDIKKNKKVRQFTGHQARVGCAGWNVDLLTTGSRDRIIYNRDVRSPQEYVQHLQDGHRQEVCGLKWDPSETYLASGGNDNRLLLWDKRQVKPFQRCTDHTAAIKALAWSPHQHGLLASGGGTADRHITFRNVLNGQILSSLDTGSQVCNLAYSKSENELVSTHGYSQNQITLWRAKDMSSLATLTGHSTRVLYLAMSPDGQNICTGAGDETLRFWNVFSKNRPSEGRLLETKLR